MKRVKLLGVLLLIGGAAAAPANARDITVQMKNQGAGGIMVFEPAYVSAKVGDTVHFVPTDPGHNATPIEGMLPKEVSAPAGAVGKPYILVLSKPGLYGIKCAPHVSMGMVALIKAGAGPAPNAADAASIKLPPLAEKRMAPLLAQAK